MDGGIFKPYRVPCGLAFGNNCYSHAKASDFGIDRYTNVTTVPPPTGSGPSVTPYERYAPDSGGSCETFNCDPSTAPCTSWIGNGVNQYTLVTGQPNTAPITWHHTTGDEVNFAVCQKQGFKNVAAQRNWHGVFGFTDPDGSGCDDTFLDCGSGDFINYRSYQATPPQTKYLECDWNASYDCSFGSVQFIETAGVWSAAAEFTGMSTSVSGSHTVTVDPLSGNISRNETNISVTSQSFAVEDGTIFNLDGSVFSTYSKGDATTISFSGCQDWSVQLFPGGYIDASGNPVGGSYSYPGDDAGIAVFPQVADGFGNTVSPDTTLVSADLQMDPHCQTDAGVVGTALAWWAINEEEGGATSITVPNDTLDGWSASGALPDVLFPDGTFFMAGGGMSITVSRSNTGYAWSVSVDAWIGDNEGGAGHTVVDASGTVELSATNTAASVYADLVSLLAYWDLTDDHVYPWRTSGLLSVAPLMTRNENATASPMQGSVCPDAIANPLFDGSILGGPLAAGHENFFCWQFTDWQGCQALDEEGDISGFDFYIYGWGMFLEDYNSAVGADLPLTATQWTNNFQAIGTPPGAYLAYNDPTIIGEHFYGGRAGIGGLVAYKYAEILERWPSQNFSRPSGADKFLYDETLVYCINDLSGSGPGATFTLTNWDGASITLGSTSGVWGGSSVGGFYHITQSGGTVTLGTKVYDLPTGWVSLSGDDDICFGKLRFDGCASLRGRQAITVSGTTATFAEGQPQFGLASSSHTEQVDLYDETYILVAFNVTATRTSDSTFTTATAYPTAVWATITGVGYYFDDDLPKGDFAVLQWGFDFRTTAEILRLTGQKDCSMTQVTMPSANFGYAAFEQDALCLPSQPCNPAVVCFTPNGETFANGITYAFPASFVLDELYGSRWQGYVQQTMTDLFWQKPHLPCGALSLSILADPGDTVDGSAITWVMDNGTCEADSYDEDSGLQTMYYPLAPMVEARLTLPSTYGAAQNEMPAALPSGISIGWLSPVDHNSGDVAYPPGAVGFNLDGSPASVMTPWVLHSLLCAATTPESTCRFKGDYENQVIDCA